MQTIWLPVVFIKINFDTNRSLLYNRTESLSDSIQPVRFVFSTLYVWAEYTFQNSLSTTHCSTQKRGLSLFSIYDVHLNATPCA